MNAPSQPAFLDLASSSDSEEGVSSSSPPAEVLVLSSSSPAPAQRRTARSPTPAPGLGSSSDADALPMETDDISDAEDEENELSSQPSAEADSDDEVQLRLTQPSAAAKRTRRSSSAWSSELSSLENTSDAPVPNSDDVVVLRRGARSRPKVLYAPPPRSSQQSTKSHNTGEAAQAVKVNLTPFIPQDKLCTESAQEEWIARQRRLPAGERAIAGPTWEGELSTEIQDEINWVREQLHDADPLAKIDYSQDDRLYERIIHDANFEALAELAQRRIRIIPQDDERLPRSPAFELCYTNRVLYEGNFLPVTPPGCKCVGSCSDPANLASCACRERQEVENTTRPGSAGNRSGLKGLAYENGVISEERLQYGDRIIECNLSCRCGPECSNRVVGKKPSVAVDIFHTPHAGWAVRNPPSYDADPDRGINESYQERVIPRGTALGIYAGELITREESAERGEVYDEVGRNYLFDADPWTAAEAIGCLDPDTREATFLDEEARQSYKPAFVIDSFSFGNWTRFCNHRCIDYNAVIMAVQSEDADPRRALLVFFAFRDIQPGEEITIAYDYTAWHAHERAKNDAAKLHALRRQAKRRRLWALPHNQCYCGDHYCYGVTFNVPADGAAPSDGGESTGPGESERETVPSSGPQLSQ